MKTLRALPRPAYPTLLVLCLCSTSAHALQNLPDESLSDVAAQAGWDITVSNQQFNATQIQVVEDSNTFYLDAFKLQSTVAGTPLTYSVAIDAGAPSMGGIPGIQLNMNQALGRQFLGLRNWHVGASTGLSGGYRAEYQGTIAANIIARGTLPNFSGALNLALTNVHLFHVENNRQVALESGSLTITVPAWTATITGAAGVTLSAPTASVALSNAVLSFRNLGTDYSITGSTPALTLNTQIDFTGLGLTARGGGNIGTNGLTLGLSGGIANTSFWRLSDGADSWRADNISATLNFPRITLDVATAPDRLEINIGNIAAPGGATAATGNLYWGNVNLNGGARALGLQVDIGKHDGVLKLMPGIGAAEGLSGDMQWQSTTGFIRFYDEAGTQYLTWSNITNKGVANGWTLGLTTTGVRLNLPSMVGDFNVGGTQINGSTSLWAGNIHYDMGVDLTYKAGGASGQGIGIDAIWTINSPGTTSFVEFLSGANKYGFYNLGGKITSTGGTIDVVNDNDGGFLAAATPRLKMTLPNNVTDTVNAPRIGSIQMNGVDMGSMQFNGMTSYLSVDMWGH